MAENLAFIELGLAIGRCQTEDAGEIRARRRLQRAE
jgi:hypothetical protein